MLGRHSFNGGGSRPSHMSRLSCPSRLSRGNSIELPRRSFIRAGAGLAAILASGRAPAALIRSMVAARNGILVGGKLTARDYVQDGLVAMWDGIENIGLSLPHDDSTTTWKDLSGNGYDAKIIRLLTHAYWEDNGFRYNKTSLGGSEYYFYVKRPTDIQSRLGNTYTIGFTGRIYPGNNRNYTGFIGDCGDGIRGFFIDRCLYNGAGYVYSGTRNGSEAGTIVFTELPLNNTSPFDVSISIACNAGLISAYLNGRLSHTASGSIALGGQGFAIGSSYDYDSDNRGRNPDSGSLYRTPLATFNRVWIYGRALSTSEVANEYTVDKARFNLTT